MASINGTTSNASIASKIEWSATQSVEGNSSTVTASLYYRRTNTYSGEPTSGTGSFTITIDGQPRSVSQKKLVIPNDKSWVLAMTATVTVIHNPDGAKDIAISATGSLPPSSLTATYCSGMVTLAQIPRASTIESVANVTLGNACSVKWTPLSTLFRYKLQFAIGNWSGWSDTINPNNTSTYPYTGYPIPIDAAKQVKGKTGTMSVTLYTYSDSGSQIGSADTKTFTVTVPENDATRPTLSMSISPVSDLPAPFNSLYIQGKSKVQATLGWEIKPGAEAEDAYITVDSTTYRYPYKSGYLTNDSVISVKGYVKDSREHYGTASENITVITYRKPVLQTASGEDIIVATRCEEDGTPKDSGEHLMIKARIDYEKVIANGVQNNFGKIQYRYRSESGSWSGWYTILDTSTSASTEIVTGALPNVTLFIDKNYLVQVRAIDNITKEDECQPVTLSVPSEKVYMHKPAGGNGMGLGGYTQKDAGKLDIYWKTMARGGISLVDKEGKEISLEETLPLPRGTLGEGWTPDDIDNGVHVVDEYPLKYGENTIMDGGTLVQMTANDNWKVQLAFPTSPLDYTPVYRVCQGGKWADWNPLDPRPQDYIVDQGIRDGWTWRKWASGMAECWGTHSFQSGVWSGANNLYYSVKVLPLPSGVFATDIKIVPSVTNANGAAVTPATTQPLGTTEFQTIFVRFYGGTEDVDITLSVYAYGRWK